jgi:hypothetical protein
MRASHILTVHKHASLPKQLPDRGMIALPDIEKSTVVDH